MGRYHSRPAPPGATGTRIRFADMCQTDVINGVLFLDDRAGLGFLNAAVQLMEFRTHGRGFYRIKRVSAVEMARLKKNSRFRRELAEISPGGN